MIRKNVWAGFVAVLLLLVATPPCPAELVYDQAYIAMLKSELAALRHSGPWGGGGTWSWVTVAEANFIGTPTDWQNTAEGVGDGSDLTFAPGVESNVWTNNKVRINLGRRGDMDKNTKGTADGNPFVLALTDPNAYLAQYGIDPNVVDDVALSGKLTDDAINPFVALLVGGTPASPEPASVTILLLGSLVLLKRKRKP